MGIEYPCLQHHVLPVNDLAMLKTASVCAGVERLYADGVIAGRTLHLRDSWTGIDVIPRA
jgi:hypothetical protein